ncbi:MAG TPA: type II toxin-antitoxin system RelE/ParE family toxin [Rhodanobacteraceae bacterium]|nr:type II toxin-antitoxin system RelE/ParE family toxin [Rhodanobacteraceae bacterium]
MTYELAFLESALKEWRKLAPQIRDQFKAKLAERLLAPHVPSARLHAMTDFYKIKLRAAGYRLVYQVDERVVLVTVVAVGRRDKGLVHLSAGKRVRR